MDLFCGLVTSTFLESGLYLDLLLCEPYAISKGPPDVFFRKLLHCIPSKVVRPQT